MGKHEDKIAREIEAKAVCLNLISKAMGKLRPCGIKFYGPYDEIKGGHCPRCGHKMYVSRVRKEGA